MLKSVSLVGLVLLSSTLLQAQVCDNSLGLKHEIGFPLSTNKQKILVRDESLLRNKLAPAAQKISRVKKHISLYRKSEIPEISNQKLAETIVRAAETTGVDFSILSSVVRKESIYCGDRHNERGGDS